LDVFATGREIQDESARNESGKRLVRTGNPDANLSPFDFSFFPVEVISSRFVNGATHPTIRNHSDGTSIAIVFHLGFVQKDFPPSFCASSEVSLIGRTRRNRLTYARCVTFLVLRS
jgi:hypothetical protein